jgi:signal transduction histidine kinase
MLTELPELRESSRLPRETKEQVSLDGILNTCCASANILLVDDRPDKLLALEAVLSDLGHLVKATSGKEALRHVLQRDFAVILLDVAMPGMDGFETAALIRQRLNSQQTPIIFVTSHNDAENHIAKGYSLGAVDYITTPIVPQILRTKVSVFVELYKKSDQIKRQGEKLLQLEEAEHRKRFNAVLEACPDIVFVVGTDRQIKLANPAAAEFATALGLNGRFPPALQAQVEQVLHSGTPLLPTTFQGVHRFRIQNAERYFLPRIVSLESDATARFGVVVVLHDVTEFRLLDEIKTNLIATVSHELKTPLTSIRTVLFMLLQQMRDNLGAQQVDMIEIASHESERLLHTLDTLLDLTRFEEGLPEMNFDLAAPRSLISAAIEETAGMATATGVQIDLSIEPDLPLVKVDRDRIIVAFTNLLTNAIKHSPRNGEVRISARHHQQDWVRFSVVDQGPGIPEAYRERIFERFFRVPGNARNGAGLGLTIAREFVRAHGGTIGLEPATARGSEFYILLKAEGRKEE